MSDRNMEQMNKERCLTEGQGKKFDDKARKAPICLHNAAAGTNLGAIGTRCRRGRGRRGTETDTRGETGPRTRSVRPPGKRGTATYAAAIRFPDFQRIFVVEAAQVRVRARLC